MRFLKTLTALSAALVLSALPAVAQEGNSGLTRLTQRGDILGWEAVGRVDVRGKGFCSGVLIATDLVLTAAHCVYDKAGALHDPSQLHYRAGLRDGVAVAESPIAQIAAHPVYEPLRGVSPANVRHDVALLKLAEPIPSATAAPFALYSGRQLPDEVSVVSFGAGRENALSWQRRCKAMGRFDGLMAFDCDVTFGSSGAPVFAKEGARARILSLISSGGDVAGKRMSFGMELPELVTELRARLRTNGAPSLNPGAGAKRVTVSRGFGQRDNGTGGGAKFLRP